MKKIGILRALSLSAVMCAMLVGAPVSANAQYIIELLNIKDAGYTTYSQPGSIVYKIPTPFPDDTPRSPSGRKIGIDSYGRTIGVDKVHNIVGVEGTGRVVNPKGPLED